MFCLSPAAALFAPTFAAGSGWDTHSRPYLAVIGPSAIRFAQAVPPPDLSVLPPAGAPPQPVAPPDPVLSAVTPSGTGAPAAAQATPPPAVPTRPESAAPARPGPPSSNAIPSILPDDTRAKVRPEDFLPYFQFPATAAQPGDVTVAVPATLTPPAPGSQPPSSATYRQQ